MPCQLPEQLEPSTTTPDAVVQNDRQGAELSKMASVGTLACMLAHEMNNLLTPVLSYAKLALEAPANERLGRRAHESAIAGVTACNAMAESLLGFVLDGSDEAPVAGVKSCVDRSIACIPRGLIKDGIRQEIKIDPSLEMAISGTALTQVILNLLLNARQAMPSGGEIAIRAECSTWNTNEPIVILSVSDSGHGIPEENISSIFDPFVSLTSGNAGTGLGLTICQQLISAVGGTIRVESQLGVGTTFTIELPQPPADRAGSEAA